MIMLTLSRGFLISFFIFLLAPARIVCRRGGFLNFQFLCYQNPDHLDFLGNTCDSVPSKNCDPFFTICISNKPIKDYSVTSCPVYYLVSRSYDNEESVCNNRVDNRDELRKNAEIELPYPLQDVYYVQIIVKDLDSYGEQYIAVFSTLFNGSPSPNNNTFVSTELFMTRAERKLYNPGATLKISIGLKCDWNLYGKHCSTFCRALDTDNFICSDNGGKVCKLGWRGPDCNLKDICLTLACAKGASCIYIDNSPKCTCNGMIGLECYPNFNPCSPNPCLNKGKCVQGQSSGNGAHCNCKLPYHGNRCELQFDLCKMYPCRNNGTCISYGNGTRICRCLSNFTGLLCDYPINVATTNLATNGTNLMSDQTRNKGINFGVLFGALFGVCLLILSIIGIYLILTSRKKKYIINARKEPVVMKYTPTREAHDSHRECKVDEYATCQEDTQYDTIDDRSTYVYQLEKNDDYLVPSRQITPAMSPSKTSNSSDYIPMFNNDNIYVPDIEIRENTIENEYFPTLPSRTLQKKPFKLKDIFKF